MVNYCVNSDCREELKVLNADDRVKDPLDVAKKENPEVGRDRRPRAPELGGAQREVVLHVVVRDLVQPERGVHEAAGDADGQRRKNGAGAEDVDGHPSGLEETFVAGQCAVDSKREAGGAGGS